MFKEKLAFYGIQLQNNYSGPSVRRAETPAGFHQATSTPSASGLHHINPDGVLLAKRV